MPHFSHIAAVFLFVSVLYLPNAVAQVDLWGTTAQGGVDGVGTLYAVSSNGTNFQDAFSFQFFSGLNPNGNIIQYGGKIYGTTQDGGIYNTGIIFEYDPSNGGSIKSLHNFALDEGFIPHDGLIQVGGKLYGMTRFGGNNLGGVIYEFDLLGTGTYNVLHHFTLSDGQRPYGRLLHQGGKFYGMTNEGGLNNYGVIFEYDPSGTGSYTVLHHFNGSLGSQPFGTLTVEGGIFYGMTNTGGTLNEGVIFSYDPSGTGTYNVLHHFDGLNGRNPEGDLLFYDGKFWGMTNGGGFANDGLLFYYDPSGAGTYSVRYFFNPFVGRKPVGGLTLFNGKIYGFNTRGGNNGWGTLFDFIPSASPNSGLAVLMNFSYYTSPYGAIPLGAPLVSGGKLFGTTFDGNDGTPGSVLFEFDLSSGPSILADFPGGSSTGYFANEQTLSWLNGKIYGMTSSGGDNNQGVVFEYDPLVDQYKVLHHFTNTSGNSPVGNNLVSYNGILYGVTVNSGPPGGVLFSLDPSTPNSYTELHQFAFTTTNGAQPAGRIIIDGDQIYGMTRYGGAFGNGVLFEYDISGAAFSILHHFDNSTGGSPILCGLAFHDNEIYGITNVGGSLSKGVLFKYELSGGTYTVLHDFDGPGGANPSGALLEKNDQIYGVTHTGGSFNSGTIFRYDLSANVFSTLYHFDGDLGLNPTAGVVEAEDKLYGVIHYTNSNFYGLIYEFDLNAGLYSIIHDFSPGLIANYPMGELLVRPSAGISVEIADPCICLDNASTPSNGQFIDTISITGPPNDVWTIIAVSNLFETSSPSPPLPPNPVNIGATIPESSPGIYLLPGIHIDSIGYTITVTNGSDTQSIGNTCYYPNLELQNLKTAYCSKEGPQNISLLAELGDDSGPATAASNGYQFELVNTTTNNLIASQVGDLNTFILNPSVLDAANYLIRATFQAADDGLSHPGCSQSMEGTFEVRAGNCGTFPWNGN